MRDYTILHLLFDSGARASEIATLNLDYFDHQNKILAIPGKGNRYRLINLWPKTASLIKEYIFNYRIDPKPIYFTAICQSAKNGTHQARYQPALQKIFIKSVTIKTSQRIESCS